jgi:hypothetical protein
MKGPFILASACQLKTDIPDQFRSVICTAALLQRNMRPIVQKLSENETKHNALFSQLPMRCVSRSCIFDSPPLYMFLLSAIAMTLHNVRGLRHE